MECTNHQILSVGACILSFSPSCLATVLHAAPGVMERSTNKLGLLSPLWIMEIDSYCGLCDNVRSVIAFFPFFSNGTAVHRKLNFLCWGSLVWCFFWPLKNKILMAGFHLCGITIGPSRCGILGHCILIGGGGGGAVWAGLGCCVQGMLWWMFRELNMILGFFCPAINNYSRWF